MFLADSFNFDLESKCFLLLDWRKRSLDLVLTRYNYSSIFTVYWNSTSGRMSSWATKYNTDAMPPISLPRSYKL